MKGLILNLNEVGAIKFGEFKMKNGLLTPVYIDLRVLISYPRILQTVADAMWEKIKDLHFDLICGIPYTALPFATLMAVQHNIPMILKRKETKDYGTKKAIEGHFSSGQICIIVDDMITNGASKFETIEPLEKEGLAIKDIIILIDREQGGKKLLAEKGYALRSILTLKDVLKTLSEENKISKDLLEKSLEFIQNNQF